MSSDFGESPTWPLWKALEREIVLHTNKNKAIRRQRLKNSNNTEGRLRSVKIRFLVYGLMRVSGPQDGQHPSIFRAGIHPGAVRLLTLTLSRPLTCGGKRVHQASASSSAYVRTQIYLL